MILLLQLPEIGIITGDKKRALEAIEKHIDNQEIAVLKQIRIDRDKKV